MAYSFLDTAAQLRTQKAATDREFHVVLPVIRCCNNCAHCVERAATPGIPLNTIGQIFCDLSNTVIGDKDHSSYDESYRENDCGSFVQVEQDSYLEEQWEELGDTPVFEDAQGCPRLDCDWWLFRKGTAVNDIWHHFDQLYTGGVAKLMYED